MYSMCFYLLHERWNLKERSIGGGEFPVLHELISMQLRPRKNDCWFYGTRLLRRGLVQGEGCAEMGLT